MRRTPAVTYDNQERMSCLPSPRASFWYSQPWHADNVSSPELSVCSVTETLTLLVLIQNYSSSEDSESDSELDETVYAATLACALAHVLKFELYHEKKKNRT